MSKSNTAETVTRPMSSTTVTRTNVCDVELRLRCKKPYTPWPALRAFDGTTAITTHNTPNNARISRVCQVLRAESSSAMASTGHSSPQVPNARMPLPTCVPSSLRSFRMGMSVPSAVVVRAMATASPSMWLREKLEEKYTAVHASTMETAQVARPFLPCDPDRLLGSIS